MGDLTLVCLPPPPDFLILWASPSPASMRETQELQPYFQMALGRITGGLGSNLRDFDREQEEDSLGPSPSPRQVGWSLTCPGAWTLCLWMSPDSPCLHGLVGPRGKSLTAQKPRL